MNKEFSDIQILRTTFMLFNDFTKFIEINSTSHIHKDFVTETIFNSSTYPKIFIH